MLVLEIGDERPGYHECKDQTGRDDKQLRLHDEPPEALVVRVQQGDPVGLKDCPEDPGCDSQRAQQSDDANARSDTSRLGW
jgi:hypothetical protein